MSVLSIQLREQMEKGRAEEEVQGHHRKQADKRRMWDILRGNQDKGGSARSPQHGIESGGGSASGGKDNTDNNPM